jgi:hypothetical protein
MKDTIAVKYNSVCFPRGVIQDRRKADALDDEKKTGELDDPSAGESRMYSQAELNGLNADESREDEQDGQMVCRQ